MISRADVCVVILLAFLAGGCQTMTKAAYARECERVETSWDEETKSTIIVEYGCKLVDPAKQRQIWMTLLQVIGAVVGIAVLLL